MPDVAPVITMVCCANDFSRGRADIVCSIPVVDRRPDLKPRLSHIPTAWVPQGCRRPATRTGWLCGIQAFAGSRWKPAGRSKAVMIRATYEQASAVPCDLYQRRPIGSHAALDLLVGLILADSIGGPDPRRDPANQRDLQNEADDSCDRARDGEKASHGSNRAINRRMRQPPGKILNH